MADHSLPQLSSTYVNFLGNLDSRLDDIARGLEPVLTSVTNPLNGYIRWVAASNKWQRWDSTLPTPDWVDLTSTYAISISGTAANATTLGGLALASGDNGPVWGSIPRIGTDGVSNIGRYLDFSNTSNSGTNFAVRLDTNNTTTDLFITPTGGSASKIITAANISASAVDLTSTQTVAGSKTFSSTIVGSISGNAATATNATTVTNGVYLTSTQTLTNKTIQGTREVKVAMSANDIDLNSGNYFTKTISSTVTFTVSNIPASGTSSSFILELTNGATAVINWFSGVKWQNGVAPILTTSGRDVLGFYTHDAGTTWTGLFLAKDVK